MDAGGLLSVALHEKKRASTPLTMAFPGAKGPAFGLLTRKVIQKAPTTPALTHADTTA